MMTTGWGAAPGDDLAPRIAYEIAAAVADGDEQATAALWTGLEEPVRARVIAALGAQARHTAHRFDNADALIAAQVIDLLADLRHCEARDEALAALAGQPAKALPACDGCPRAAAALARARLRVLEAAGFTAPLAAEISRRAARH